MLRCTLLQLQRAASAAPVVASSVVPSTAAAAAHHTAAGVHAAVRRGAVVPGAALLGSGAARRVASGRCGLQPRRFASTAPAEPAAAPAASPAGAPKPAAAAEAEAAPAKPRAEGGHARKAKKRGWLWPAVATSAAVFAYYVTGGNPAEAYAQFRDWLASLTETKLSDPTIEDLQNALGPAPPEGFINVIIAMEDVVLKKDWNSKTGWTYELRPGLKDTLKKLTEGGCMITFWSVGASSGAIDAVNKMSLKFQAPIAVTPLHLGSEHMFSRPGTKDKEKNVRFFNRPLSSVLLVDCDPHSLDVNPYNTFVIRSMSATEAESAKAAAAGEAPPTDTSLAAVAALVDRVRAEFQETFKVDIPATLRKVREEAASRGFGADADGVYRYLQHSAWEASERERLRREAGLGGGIRRALGHMPALRGAASTVDAAEAAPYRDPVVDAGEDALLTAKVHAALARMDAMMGRAPR